jgi:SAM-dependent methyltransferase
MNINDDLIRKCWNENARVWTELSDSGYDICRDLFNTPAFFAMLPDVSGKSGIDVGCGNGYHTRKLAELGAKMTGIDICDEFLNIAQVEENANPKGITYINSNSTNIPFPDNHFDFATAVMSLMDMTDPKAVIAEVFRILKPGGFLQFNICHPNTDMLLRKPAFDENGNVIGLILGKYYDAGMNIDEWIFGSAPEEVRKNLPLFKIPGIRMTLAEWINMIADCGYIFEKFCEPCPDKSAIDRFPQLATGALMPFYLHMRVRKPE